MIGATRSRDGSQEIFHLKSIHEEANGCFLLHAAKEDYSSVLINSDDTDFMVMCLTFHNRIGGNVS